MDSVAHLKWHQHRRPCVRSRKHHRKILAVTSRLAALALHVPFSLSLISQLSRCHWRYQWFVEVCTHSVSQSHLLANKFALFQVLHMFFWPWRHMLEPFSKVFSSHGSVHWMVWTLHSRSLVQARNNYVWVLSNLQGRHLLLSMVLRWVFVPQDALLCWVPRRWGFGFQDCNHGFLETLNQYFADSTKVRGSESIEFPSSLFLC